MFDGGICTKILVIVVNTCVCRRSVDNRALILSLSYPLIEGQLLFKKYGAVIAQIRSHLQI